MDFFPVLFAVPRVVGWLAHWRQGSSVASAQNNSSVILVLTDDAPTRRGKDLASQTGNSLPV
jgi:Citrate synthase, C-terminal domain